MNILQNLRDRMHILVAATREIDDDYRIFIKIRRDLYDMSDRMRRLKCGNDSFRPGQKLKCTERLIVRHGNIFDTILIVQESMLRTDRRIVEARRNRMRRCDLSVAVLQQIAFRPLQNADRAASHKPRRVIAEIRSAAAGLDSDHPNVVAEKLVKQSDRI